MFASRTDHSMEAADQNPSKNVVMVPVPKEDFKKINELAEASWIAKDPNNVEAIKEQRKSLLRKVTF